jgi:hypothetical protein
VRRFELREPTLHDAFISLTGDNPKGHTDAITNGIDHRAKPFRRAASGPRNSLESQHNQPIPGQHRQRLTKGAMHRRPTPAHIRIVETGQIIMHQRIGMQHFNRRRHAQRR